jgi:dihydroxyacetone kinase
MKKIMNTPETFVSDMCRGLVKAYPELEFIEKYKIVRKNKIDRDKVSLLSGGGSGHEPAHAGFVGRGMLDCAVCGDIFASPSQVQIRTAIKECATDRGVLLIVKNYSGDCMNFNAAADDAADEDGIKVEKVYVNDDIAVKDSLYTVGRRGVAGTLLVHKCAGAAADMGKDLNEVKTAAQKTIDNVRSFGFALSSCTPPSKGTPIFDIAEDEVEFGVGIHGEPGRKTEKIQTADVMARRIVADITADLSLRSGDEVVLLINGFGATPLMELYLFNNSVSNELEKAGISIHKTLVGNFMTSIDMAGASVTLLKLDAELKALIDYPVSTPALAWGGLTNVQEAEASMHGASGTNGSSQSRKSKDSCLDAAKAYDVEGDPVIGETINTAAFVGIVSRMADIIIEHEVPFCDADKMGDGDFGMSIAKGFRRLKSDWAYIEKDNIGTFLGSCSAVIKEYCGGASGPIWGSAFSYAGKAAAGKKEVSLADLAVIFHAANTGVYETGRKSFGRGAVVGDKTLVDALKPCADALQAAAADGMKLRDGIDAGAKAAVAGAEATKVFAAALGRAGTVGEKSIGYPDAGAYGLGVIFTALAAYIGNFK